MKIYEFNSNEKNLFIKTTDTLFPQLPKENIMVFDIDTTSFEAANGCVFLIGTLTYEDNTLISRHYFSESISEETEIIEKFLDIAGDYNVLLSFKGESFDIAFIGKRIYELKKQNSQDRDLCDKLSFLYNKLQNIRSRSYDVFNEIHAIKPYMDFTSTKLDTLRAKFGQKVTERVSGENISKFYVEHIAANKLKSLLEITCKPENVGFIPDYDPKPIEDELAHIDPDSGDRFLENILARNRENMEAVLYIMRLSHLFVMRQGSFSMSYVECSRGAFDTAPLRSSGVGLPHVSEGTVLSDTSKMCQKEPSPLTHSLSLHIQERDFSIDIPLEICELDLKIFYANFKDYYYFPAEDMAVHKSVAEFADAASKKKATSKTAYRKVSGSFVRIPTAYAKSDNNKASNRYKTDYEAEEYYLPLDEIKRLDTEKLKEIAYYCVLDYGKEHLQSVLI